MKEKRIGLYLITGFLGTGKTTLLNHFLEGHPSHKIGVIVNEFGKESIDAHLIRPDTGITMHEINNGSIFCCCRTADFHQALVQLSSLDMDLVVVEATGLADPANLSDIFDGVNQETHDAYVFKGCYCLLDATHFLQMYAAIPVLEKQAAYSDCVIINKCDLADAADIEKIKDTVSAINPDASVHEASYGRIDMPDACYTIKTPAPSQNTPRDRPQTEIIPLDHALTRQEADNLIQDIQKRAYRAKGFATIDGQKCYIDIVGGDYTVTPFPFSGDDKMVLLKIKELS